MTCSSGNKGLEPIVAPAGGHTPLSLVSSINQSKNIYYIQPLQSDIELKVNNGSQVC